MTSGEIQDAPGLAKVLAEVRKERFSVHSLFKLYNFINAWAAEQRELARKEVTQS